MTRQNNHNEEHCLLCEEPIFKRKLCQLHYGQFRRRLTSLPRDKWRAFDDKAVKKGLIGPDARNVEDPFAEALEEFIAEEGISAVPEEFQDTRDQSPTGLEKAAQNLTQHPSAKRSKRGAKKDGETSNKKG